MSDQLTSDQLTIEDETVSQDGQTITLVRLGGELTENNMEEAATRLLALATTPQGRHLRIDLQKVRLSGVAATIFFDVARQTHRVQGNLALLNVGAQQRRRLDAFPFEKFMTIAYQAEAAPEGEIL